MPPGNWFRDAFQDIRFSLRQFRRRPGFAILAVLTLACGIGGTTAVYTVVHAVLLRAPLYDDPASLVIVWDNAPRDGDQVRQILASPADYREYVRSAKLLEHIALMGRTLPVLKRDGVAHRQVAGVATTGLFRDTLRLDAILGRTFDPSDEAGGCSVILAHPFWTSTFGADPTVVGHNLDLDNTACTVIGVMPAGFSLFPNTANMWFLAGHTPASPRLTKFGAVLARLKPGVSMQQAGAELTALHQAANRDMPTDGDNEHLTLVPAIDSVESELTFLTAPTLRFTLWITFGAVLMLLLIACLNVANLMLARLAERQRELIVRAALGCGRMRLIRQVLAEGLLLAVTGTAVGAAAAEFAVRWFRHVSPIKLPPHAGEVRVDLAVLAFATALAIGTTLLFGLLPAFQASRLVLTRGPKSSRRRMAQILVALQVAVSFVLLIGSGLLLSSAVHLGSERLGFETERLISVGLELPGGAAYSRPAERNHFRQTLVERIEALSGVEMVVPDFIPPWDPNDNIVEQRLEIEGQSSAAAFFQGESASPRLFEMLGTRLRAGRFFDAHDTGAPVAIVSARVVADHFAGQNPLGQRIRFFDADAKKPSPWKTIVGVVDDWKHLVRDAQWRDTPVVFTPEVEAGAFIQLAVKTSGDPAPLVKEIQKQITTLEANAEITGPSLLRDKLAQNLLYPEFRAGLLASFALGALILAAVGLHGVLAQLVTQRTPEFGVRRAVGAQTLDVLWLVARQGGGPVLTGLLVGLIAALALTRVIQSMLYGVTPADPEVLASTAGVLLLAAILAMALPARRAVRVDPMAALREE